MEALGKLFGTPAKIKLMRLFLFNPESIFEPSILEGRARLSALVVRRELKSLARAGFIKKKIFYKQRTGKRKSTKQKIQGFTFDDHFPYTHPLRSLLVDATPLRKDILLRRLERVGKVKLIIVSGIFIQDGDSRLDLLIVGDRLNKSLLERTIRSLESDLGKELRYAYFEMPEFNYRLNIFDKLIRDVFDYPHQKLLDKIGLTGS